MTGSSFLSAAQLADMAERQRDGRPDKTAMTNEERWHLGLMTRKQAAEHERLRSLPVTRLAERIHGPDPDDPWALGEAS